MPDPSEAQTFFAVTEDGVTEVEIFLDQRMIDNLCAEHVPTWAGLLAYIQDDLRIRDAWS